MAPFHPWSPHGKRPENCRVSTFYNYLDTCISLAMGMTSLKKTKNKMPSNNVCTSWMLMTVTGINLTDHPTASPADLNNHWCHFLTATSGCSRERGSQNTARSLANCSRSCTQHVVQMDRYWELPPHQSFDTMENQASGIKSATPTAVNCSLYLATRNILNLKHYCPTAP